MQFRLKALYARAVTKYGGLTKTHVKAMKITGIVLLAACLQVSASGYGQRITLSVKDSPLEQVFQKIKQQTGLSFLWDEQMLIGKMPVTLDVRNASLDEVMDACLKGQDLTYTILSNLVVIRESDKAPPVEAAVAPDNLPPGTVRGHVTDSTGAPLAGATVRIKGTKKGTATDSKGDFLLPAVDGQATIVVSYTSYETQEIKLDGKGNVVNVRMKYSTSPLDAIQIVAYGTNTQRFNVGSVSTVTAATIEQQPVSNPLLALEGQVPGLQITPTGGAPGAAVQVQIRGQNTLESFGSRPAFDQPLFIVDGVPLAQQNNFVNQFNNLTSGNINTIGANQYAGTSPFNLINPLDIESITVLKDADATSIYGTQGSNGVILITTKKGKAGKTSFNLTANTGPVRDTRLVSMMNTPQYLQMRNEAYQNDGITPNPNNGGMDLLLFDSTRNVDWFKQFYGGTANNTSLHGTLSGGNINTTFIVSAGESHQTYNFPGNYADNTMTLHTGFHHNTTDHNLSLDFGTDFSYDQNNSSGNPDVLGAFTLPPDFPALTDQSGNLVWSYKGYDLGEYFGIPNAFAYLHQPAKLQGYQLNNHLGISYRIFNGLIISSSFGYSRYNNQEYMAQPLISLDPAENPSSIANFGTTISETLTVDPQLNYTQKISKGRLSLTFGGEYKKSSSDIASVGGSGFANDALLGSIDDASRISASDASSQYKYDALFGRIGYIWDSKYILSLNGRRDGSSNFGPDRQFGNFGSVAGGWIFSEEPFFKRSAGLSFISYGKLHVSYGTTGSDGISPYQYQPNWVSNGNSSAFQGLVSYSPSNLFNPDYSWSVNKQINAGVSLGFFKDRLLANIDLYQKRTSDQLVFAILAIQTGFNNIAENFPASLQDRGWEGTLSSTNFKTKEFTWTSSFNISANYNKLIAFPGLAKSDYAIGYFIGRSTSSRAILQYAGVDPATGVFQFLTAKGVHTFTPNELPAANGYGGDANTFIDQAPKFSGGLANTFTYKGFSLMLFFNFCKQIGYNYAAGVYLDGALPGGPQNQPARILNGLWQNPGDHAQFEILTTGANSAATNGAYYFAQSTGAFSNASYIRLKTMGLSWRIPANYTRKAGIQDAKININAQNLFTITPYKVLDPEEPGQLYGFPMQKTVVAGVSLTF